MQNIENRISKLRTEEQKLNEKINEYNQKISDIHKKIEELENQRIVSAVRSTGFSLEDLIIKISALKTSEEINTKNTEVSNETYSKGFTAYSAEEKEKSHEN